MNKKSLGLVVALCCSAPTATYACYDHMMFNPDQMGLGSGTIARMAGLVREPVFDVDTPLWRRFRSAKKTW